MNDFFNMFRRTQDKNLSKLNILSDNGKELISKCQRKRTITGRDNIIQKLREEEITISKAIVDFQEFYGGLSCQFGGSTEQGFLLDLFSNCHCDYKKPQVYTYNNQYLVECIHNYDIWTIRGFIGEDGKIYRCIQEKFSIIADSINEFLDSNVVILRV